MLYITFKADNIIAWPDKKKSIGQTIGSAIDLLLSASERERAKERDGGGRERTRGERQRERPFTH